MTTDPSTVDAVVNRTRDALVRVRELARVQAPLAAPIIDRVIEGVLQDVTMLVRFWETAESDAMDLLQQLPAQSTLDI